MVNPAASGVTHCIQSMTWVAEGVRPRKSLCAGNGAWGARPKAGASPAHGPRGTA